MPVTRPARKPETNSVTASVMPMAKNARPAGTGRRGTRRAGRSGRSTGSHPASLHADNGPMIAGKPARKRCPGRGPGIRSERPDMRHRQPKRAGSGRRTERAVRVRQSSTALPRGATRIGAAGRGWLPGGSADGWATSGSSSPRRDMRLLPGHRRSRGRPGRMMAALRGSSTARGWDAMSISEMSHCDVYLRNESRRH